MRTQSSCALLFLLAILGGQAYCQTTPATSDYWSGYQSQSQSPISQSAVLGPTPIDRVLIDVGTIGLMREKPDSQILAFDQSGKPILDADSLQGPMQFGTKAKVDFRNVSSAFGGTDLQFGYFGINSMDANTQVSADRVFAHFFGGFPLDPPKTYNFNYSTNLYSGEANLRFGGRNSIRPIVGLRYLRLEDTYDVYESANNAVNGFFSTTNNDLFGGQLGLEGDFWRSRRVSFYGFGKVGAMNNRINGTATSANHIKDFSDSTYCTLVDGGAGANIHFVGPLSFRVGYRSLFASSLALGIDQNEAVSIFPGPDTLKFNSQHWHGVDLAAIFQF